MDIEKDIKFLKWMVEKAENIEWIKDVEGDEYIKFTSKIWLSVDCIDNDETWEYVLYPTLLQRAIEGININGNGYFIDQHNDGCDIISKSGRLIEKCRLNNGTFDKAKEASLKYIYEQETK